MADDNFWNSSEVKGFNFDDEESNDQVFGIPLKGASRLSQQLKDGLKLDSESNYDFTVEQVALHGSSKYDLLQLISEKSLNAIIEAETVDVQISKSDCKPDEELRLLRHQVLSRWDTPNPNSVIKNIILGRPYSLELFRSLQSKKDLLNAATEFGDGDAILEVAYFLSKTLKKSLFQQIMFNCPLAVSHYIHYLSVTMQIQEVTDFLELLGRHKDASVKQFKLIASNPQRNFSRLKTLGSKYFFDSKDKVFVENFSRLVECQMEIKDEVGLSVVATIRNICEKHWNDSNGISPFTMCKEQCLSDKQFQWTLLGARASQQDWSSIHSMFITKGWLGSKKIKSAIPMDQIVMQLHRYKAPEDVLSVYFALIEDTDLKLNLAKKLQCHKVIIDTFASQRDRVSLKRYMTSLSPQDDHFSYAEFTLASAIKWKN